MSMSSESRSRCSRGSRRSTVAHALGAVTALVAMVASEQTAWADGTVVCWGDNNNGQVTTPVGLIDVAQVAGGGIHTVALRRDGTVVCWGYN